MFKKIIGSLNKKKEDVDLLHQLHKTPQAEKGKDMPTFQDFKPNFRHQADLLFLPTAKFGFKYLLVVVDDATRHFDAEPLKGKDASMVTNALKRIYKRDILQKPKLVEVDDGTEFKGQFKKYLNSEHIIERTAETARHRQQALVESKNHIIGKVLNYIMNLKEIENKKTSTDWYRSEKEFRELIKNMNDHISYKPKKGSDNILVSKNNKDLLIKGTKVRVLLDYPIDIANERRQIGKFRAGDIRWSKEIHTVEWNVLEPNQPPLYKVSGENILRTIQQLQPV